MCMYAVFSMNFHNIIIKNKSIYNFYFYDNNYFSRVVSLHFSINKFRYAYKGKKKIRKNVKIS